MATLEGEIWFRDEAANRLLLDQLDLLRAIAETGSISAAGKLLGISYKTAWDRLDRLNNLSDAPLVSRVAGGSKGGGSQLTKYGESVLNGFAELKQVHQEFLASLNTQLSSLDDISGFVRSSAIQSSARNQFLGVITTLESGAVNAEVIIQIADEIELTAIVTQRSSEQLRLSRGDSVMALVKASSVTLAIGELGQISARNCLSGFINRIDHGAVNTDVSIDLGDNKTLSAMVTNRSAESMGLQEGLTVSAFFKASSVILMRT